MKARSQSSSIRTKRFSVRRQQRSKSWTCAGALRELRALGERRNVEGMARFGIRAMKVYGVAKPKMDLLVRKIGRNRRLALELWKTGVHDARILAGMIDEAAEVTAEQMDDWVRDFDNWDVCDGTCCHLFGFAEPAWEKAAAWSLRKAEFEKRAGFALMAYLAVHDKEAKDDKYLRLLPMIRREAHDERNFVRKAVNWALRQIGKRNLRLNRAAIQEAGRIRKMDSRTARWIAADALRELRSEAVARRLRAKTKGKRHNAR
jgi:3-methyladenine DNA glycosylase AlkD